MYKPYYTKMYIVYLLKKLKKYKLTTHEAPNFYGMEEIRVTDYKQEASDYWRVDIWTF